MNTSKILYVPAWYPSLYMEEQINMLCNEMPHILTGNIIKVGKKKYIYKYITQKKRLTCWPDNENNCNRVELLWLNSDSEIVNRKQLRYVIAQVDNIIKRMFNGEKPQLVHFHAISDFSVMISKWADLNDIPFVITEHVLYVRHSFDFWASLKERMYERAKAVLCVSNYVYRNLIVHGIKLEKVWITGNLINTQYVPSNLANIKKNNRVIFVASHIADKDINVLFEVVKLIKDKKFFDIWGLTGDERFDESVTLKEKVRELGIEDWVCFKGKKKHEELLKALPYYSTLLSTSCSETFGIAIAEAIAYGVYVVCTDSGGIRDFVNEANAKVVPIRDVERIVDFLDRDFVPSLESSDQIVCQYNEDVFLDKMKHIYLDVLK